MPAYTVAPWSCDEKYEGDVLNPKDAKIASK